jgi:integrase
MKKPIIFKKRGRIWYFRRAGEKTFHSTETTTEAARDIFIDDLKEKEAEAAKKGPSVTLEAFAADFFQWGSSPWIKRQQAKKRPFGKAQAQNRQNHLDRYILPRFGKTALAEITKPDIEDWLLTLPLENATRNHIMYSLRIVLRDAKGRNLIAENPLQEPEPLGKTAKTRDVFSAAELRALFPANLATVWHSQSKGVLFMVLASTGIRSGECRALVWKQVLWADKALLVNRTVNKSEELAAISEKKGGSKIVLLPSRTLAELRAWHDMSLWHEPDDFIFSGSARGHPLGSAAVAHALAPAIRRVNRKATEAGLPLSIQAAGRALTVHGFRHTWITSMRRMVPEDTLRALSGHHSVAMTDLYDHPAIEAQLKALEPARAPLESVFGKE